MKFGFKVLILLLFLFIGFDQSRSFYCLSGNHCVTVWKRLGNKCYIIPGKYYNVVSPSNNYLETSNTQYLTIYFTNKIPNKIIVKNQGDSGGDEGGFKIKSSSKENWEMLEYLEQYKSIIYKTEASKLNEVQETTSYINLYIDENYATDKTGKKLK